MVPCWATTLAPLIDSVAVCASLLSVSGLTSNATFGTLPPAGKNASRISAAYWNWRSVVSESLRAGFGFHTQVLPVWFTSGSRLAEKNLSIVPPGREEFGEIGHRHVAVALGERIAVGDDLLTGRGDVLRHVLGDLGEIAGGRVAGRVLGDLVDLAGERLGQTRRIGSQARHLDVDLLQRLFGLRRVLGGKNELPIKLVEIGDQGVDRARPWRSVHEDGVGLEIGFDRRAGDLGRRFAGLALRLDRQVDRLPAPGPELVQRIRSPPSAHPAWPAGRRHWTRPSAARASESVSSRTDS